MAASSSKKILQATVSNANWHQGNPLSTPEVDVSYTENYKTVPYGGNTSIQVPILGQYMWLTYKDGTESRVEFQFLCAFAPGGLDIANQKVLNWSKLISIETILFTETHVNNTLLSSMYSFQGFSIVSGNASQVSLSQIKSGNTTITVINNVIGSISYWSSTGVIGNVTLSTAPYTYQASTLEESIATFNVTINSVMSTAQSFGTTSADAVNVPTVLTFRVTHTVYQTTAKYGAHIDWSSTKAFPTRFPILTGQDYSLVAQDLLAFVYGYSAPEAKQYSTDAKNDTAIYMIGGKEIGRELFTTQCTIKGDPQIRNTTRIYIPNVGLDPFSGVVSSVYVIFDGFKYNQTAGFTFDPEIITPDSLVSSNNPSLIFIGLLTAGIASAAVATLFAYKRRKHGVSKTEPSESSANTAPRESREPRPGSTESLRL